MTCDMDSLLTLNLLGFNLTTKIAAELLKGISPGELYVRILEENLWCGRDTLKQIEKRFDAGREQEHCQRQGLSLVTLQDPLYPQCLREIEDPPLVLYCRGGLTEGDCAAAAVVGTRHPSLYGLEQAGLFGAALAESGLTVVSGLARGIDQAAHEGALRVSHGRTLAVLGCGADRVYPADAVRLAERIADRGAVLSEFPLGTPPLAYHFPRRNRIISGMAQAVLVVEAHTRSGSLITARLALEQGREVLAVPGRLGSPAARGANRLIAQGAGLAESPQDLMEAAGRALILNRVNLPDLRKKKGRTPDRAGSVSAEPGPESGLMRLLQKEGTSLGELAGRSGLAPQDLSRRLMELEIRGAIVRRPDGIILKK